MLLKYAFNNIDWVYGQSACKYENKRTKIEDGKSQWFLIVSYDDDWFKLIDGRVNLMHFSLIVYSGL